MAIKDKTSNYCPRYKVSPHSVQKKWPWRPNIHIFGGKLAIKYKIIPIFFLQIWTWKTKMILYLAKKCNKVSKVPGVWGKNGLKRQHSPKFGRKKGHEVQNHPIFGAKLVIKGKMSPDLEPPCPSRTRKFLYFGHKGWNIPRFWAMNSIKGVEIVAFGAKLAKKGQKAPRFARWPPGIIFVMGQSTVCSSSTPTTSTHGDTKGIKIPRCDPKNHRAARPSGHEISSFLWNGPKWPQKGKNTPYLEPKCPQTAKRPRVFCRTGF